MGKFSTVKEFILLTYLNAAGFSGNSENFSFTPLIHFIQMTLLVVVFPPHRHVFKTEGKLFTSRGWRLKGKNKIFNSEHTIFFTRERQIVISTVNNDIKQF
jgi:hypothetical protein